MVEWSIHIPTITKDRLRSGKFNPPAVDIYKVIQFMRQVRNCSLEEASGTAFPATFTSAQMLEAWRGNPDMDDPKQLLHLALEPLLESGLSFTLVYKDA